MQIRTTRPGTLVGVAITAVLVVAATVVAMQAWSVDAAPGDDDSTYVPVSPCRLFDMRPGYEPAGGKKTPLGPGVLLAHTQQVTGFVGNCVIPADAVAVAMNVTITNPTERSNLRIFPADLSVVPTVSNLNWLAGETPTANKVDVRLSADGRIRIFNAAGTVNVLADVVGYYTDASLQELGARVAALEASQPAAVTDVVASTVDLSDAPSSIVDVTVTAPVDGDVAVVYSATTTNADAGAENVCAPFRSDEIPPGIGRGSQGAGLWQAPFDDANGSVSGTRLFPISAGQTVGYSVACEQYVGTGSLFGATMTATFIPS